MDLPSDAEPAQPPKPRHLSGGRRPALDIVRGVAVVAMVAYHSAWDLGELNLIETDVTRVLAWSLFARAIAASFLVVSGIALMLAQGGGLRPFAFGRRLAVVTVAALAVTVVTRLAFPASYIFFGILHNIALSSLVALPFLRAPAPVTAAVAACILGAPLVLSSPTLDAPILAFLGLGARVPVTNDFVPVFPWTGFVLTGVAAGHLLLRRAGLPTSPPRSRPAAALAWLGRHSLAIYLLHQPVVFGALWCVVQVTGPNPVAEAAPFLRHCTQSCQAAGQDPGLCRGSCSCTVDGLRTEGLWPRIARGVPEPDDLVRASRVAQACLRGKR